MIEALAQDRLQRVVVHLGARLGNQQSTVAAYAQRGVNAVHANIRAVVERGRGLIAIDGRTG